MSSFTYEQLQKGINISEHINNELIKEIQKELDSVGVYYRIFGRTKTISSIVNKLNKKNYSVGEKMMQDVIGLRVVVYFNDDIELCREILNGLFTLDNEEYDHPSTEEFKPIRINMVFKLPEQFQTEMIINNEIPIDKTFEVQIRTVFSEGWHEIEHDLRYKRKRDWDSFPVYSRMLNGIFATLETCDWSIIQLLDSISHEHYTHGKWIPMCINHFRMKFILPQQSDEEEINEMLDRNKDLAKAILRYNRLNLIVLLRNKYRNVPHTLKNVIYIINIETLRDEDVVKTTPQLIMNLYST